MLVVLAISGCMTAQRSEIGSYEIEAASISVPVESRDVTIPGTLVMPVGKGKFPLVVIAHGHGGTREENGGLTNIAEELAHHGIASIRVDFSGCGESSESFQQNTLSNMIDDVNAALAYVESFQAIDSKKLGIFGYSMGGRIAVAMIAEEPERFDAAVLLAPAADDQTMVNFLGGQDAWNKYYETAQSNGYTNFTTLFGQEQELSQEWFEDLEDSTLLERAQAYSGKSLVIYGEDDFVVSPEVSKATAAALGSVLLDVTGDTHSYSFYSDNPEIRSAILDGTVGLFLDTFM